MSRGNADLGVVALPFSQTDMSAIPFAEAEVVAALPARHPLAGRRTVGFSALAGERFIALRPSTLLRAQIDVAAASAGVSINPVIETSSGVAACELVARGLGVMLSDLSFAKTPASGQVANLRRVIPVFRLPALSLFPDRHQPTRPDALLTETGSCRRRFLPRSSPRPRLLDEAIESEERCRRAARVNSRDPPGCPVFQAFRGPGLPRHAPLRR